MTVHVREAQAGPESIPPRARFGFRISRSQRPFELPWCVEVWGKPPHVYAKTEAQSLFDAIRMMIIARSHTSREQANKDRAALISYLETDGTPLERLWLPLIRWVHRRCTR